MAGLIEKLTFEQRVKGATHMYNLRDLHGWLTLSFSISRSSFGRALWKFSLWKSDIKQQKGVYHFKYHNHFCFRHSKN